MEKRPLRLDAHRLASDTLREVHSALIDRGVPEYGDYVTEALRCLNEGNVLQAEKMAKTVLELAWEELHIGEWKSVAMVWRDLYALGALTSAMCALRKSEPTSVADAIAFLDKGILMGGPRLHAHFTALITELTELAADPTQTHKRSKAEPEVTPVAAQPPRVLRPPPAIRPACAIGRVSRPSMEDFYKNYMQEPAQPVIITNAMQHWPALTRWRDVEYLRKKAGMRVVPVEVGRTYLSEEWGQKLITISEFIDQFVLNADKSPSIGYLAQTKLFDQIPELRADIDTPTYCYLGDDDKDLAVNAWFGPGGTVSPLHQDPHDNVLAQVVGSKYIRLYDPRHTECVYPHAGNKLLFNTSQVDVEAPDNERFPRFASAPCVECILGAGEMLFIPKGWWHYVRSLEMSFSVSFWY